MVLHVFDFVAATYKTSGVCFPWTFLSSNIISFRVSFNQKHKKNISNRFLKGFTLFLVVCAPFTNNIRVSKWGSSESVICFRERLRITSQQISLAVDQRENRARRCLLFQGTVWEMRVHSGTETARSWLSCLPVRSKFINRTTISC